MPTPKFLELSDVLEIHDLLIVRTGGTPGLRDEGLLDSALAQPKASFFGELLHPTIPEQAAAYLYHLSRNHAFLDGNKRRGTLWVAAVMQTFLQLNGYSLELSEDEKYNVVMQVAQGQMSKEDLAAYLKQHLVKKADS